MKRKINDESPMRVVNGYYSQDDHQYTHTQGICTQEAYGTHMGKPI